MTQRDFDIVLYGATGFTGRQTVRYFAQHAPQSLRWAIAGRDSRKLESLDAAVPIIVADSRNERQVAQLAANTRVVLSTAGPFALFSDTIVAACVEAGTHYVDITGETAWVRSLIDRFHAKAVVDGTRIISFCGFDSVPADLGVSLLIKEMGPKIVEAKAYFQLKGGSPNGGTVATGLNTYESGAAERMREPFLLSPERTREPLPVEEDVTRAAYDKDLGVWVAPFPMSAIDTRVVRRSCSLMGIDLAFQEFATVTGSLSAVRAQLAAIGTTFFSAAMKYPFFRKMAEKAAQSGMGPPTEVMDSGWFRARFWGRDTDGHTAEATIAGAGDPANRITVKCVCESALAIACDSDKLPDRAGVITPSVGIGEILIDRLREQGIRFAVNSSG